MKRFILAALLSLPLLAAAGQTASAGDCCSPTFRIGFSMAFKGWAGCSQDCGCNPNPNPCCGGCNSACVNWGQLAPWYSYWPYDGHFQTPAPTGYPYYPPAMSPVGYNYGAPAANYGAMAGYGYGAPAGYGAPGGYAPPTMQAGYYAPQMNTVQPASYYQYQAPAYWYGR
jgi:hypothetical protein